jgi:lipopolysaccharide transport system ATP-binding protein
VVFRGRLGSLLEVGTGFHPELTGRENIFLSGAILNMTRREIARQFKAIVDFAEMEDFVDTPVKHYSSGMYVRLGFAVAAHTAPDILLVDEVLSVGDLKFQRKCMDHAKSLRQRNATTLIVSHNMFTIKALCDRAIYLAQGRLVFDGCPEQAIQLYEKDSRLETPAWAQTRLGTDPTANGVHVCDLEVMDEEGQPRTVFSFGERMRLRLRLRASKSIKSPNLVIAILRADNVPCCNFSSETDGFSLPPALDNGIIEVVTPPLKLVAELYIIHLLVWDKNFGRLHCAQIGKSFHVRHDVFSSHFGVFHEPAEWSWHPKKLSSLEIA